jgi:2-isopropylmalate synthase
VFAHPDAAAEAANFPTLRDRRVDDKLATLMKVSRTLDEMLNRAPNRHAPYVGESAFATKAGIHASAIAEGSADLRARAPEARRQPSQGAGVRSGRPLQRARRARTHRHQASTRTTRARAPARRGEGARGAGYAYEAADASFELLARRTLGKGAGIFPVEQFDVNVEQRYNANGQRVTVAMAVVKVEVAGERLISAAEGNGPVNALDVALRKDLGKYQKYIEGLKLTTIACVSSMAAPKR